MHRRFVLVRDQDLTGISGTGKVAEGIQFTDGHAVMRWCVNDKPASTSSYDVVADVESIHGHGGTTRVVWLDEEGWQPPDSVNQVAVEPYRPPDRRARRRPRPPRPSRGLRRSERVMTRVLAIDPGNTESAYVVVDGDRRPLFFAKIRNDELLGRLRDPEYDAIIDVDRVAVEMVASYGMAVGADVFETCVWIGRFYEALRLSGFDPQLVKRHPVKLHHCQSARAKDTNIRQALVDRFASGAPNHGKGTKADPGWFYGFRADVWQAYALAVYIADTSEAT